ncbi:MAG: hypothetical protein KF708_01705 [Pirellulales bacterium]|nr:hypothetical protein [Pirellulales bacterium]
MRKLVALTCAAALAVAPLLLVAAERKPKSGEYNPKHKSVELFSAIEQGDLEVELIPRDSTQARLMIHNKTGEALNVKLPETFAGVQVLAQIGGGIGGGGNRGGGGGGGQSFGGGMGGGGFGGGGMGGGGFGGGQFNVAPERVGEVKVRCVCLEHGKDEPRPKMHYELRPLDTVNDDPRLRVLMREFGKGELDQRATQAAAWHIANGMSWEELAAKEIKRANGTREPYFSPEEMQTAVQMATVAERIAKEEEANEPEKSQGDDHESSASLGDELPNE